MNNNKSCSAVDRTNLFPFQEASLHALSTCHHQRQEKKEACRLWNCDFHDTINNLKKKNP